MQYIGVQRFRFSLNLFPQTAQATEKKQKLHGFSELFSAANATFVSDSSIFWRIIRKDKVRLCSHFNFKREPIKSEI